MKENKNARYDGHFSRTKQYHDINAMILKGK